MTTDEILAVMEAHLFDGMVVCLCGWRISMTKRPLDPYGQQRRHVAEKIVDALSREERAS